jgi:hypothetical protein
VTLASHALASPTRAGNVGATLPVISANGGIVAFTSSSSNLVTGDYNQADDVFLYVADPAPEQE